MRSTIDESPPERSLPVIPGGSLRASIHDSSRLTDNFANGMCPWLFFEPHPPPLFFTNGMPVALFCERHVLLAFCERHVPPAFLRTACAVKGFRMPASHCARGCTEAGVRKASKEETAGEFAPTPVSIYGKFAAAA